MTKSRIFKNLSLKRKADRNFCGILLENHFRYLKLYSTSPIKEELNPWKQLFLLNLNFGLAHKSKIWPILYGDMFMSEKFSVWKLRAFGLKLVVFLVCLYPYQNYCEIYYSLVVDMRHLRGRSVSLALIPSPTQVDIGLVVKLQAMQQLITLVIFFRHVNSPSSPRRVPLYKL